MDGGFQEVEHMLLQRCVESVLEAFGEGRIDRNRAAGLLVHVTLSAAGDRAGEFHRFIGLDPEAYLAPPEGPPTVF